MHIALGFATGSTVQLSNTVLAGMVMLLVHTIGLPRPW